MRLGLRRSGAERKQGLDHYCRDSFSQSPNTQSLIDSGKFVHRRVFPKKDYTNLSFFCIMTLNASFISRSAPPGTGSCPWSIMAFYRGPVLGSSKALGRL